ncbi:COX15/CtaA family protein [Asticcacaulis sp.]|uniref:COX15/CtaA family protein n=1 Tax=Asticcacaulis sp. TaxID=1872648 RepID=UPI0039C8584E
MTRIVRLPLKSPLVAVWLFVAAFLVLALVCVGGATRLTESGLSITEWKPIAGVIPPVSEQAWTAEFDNYKKIPQFSQVNPHMDLAAFKGIYWWEWTHRLLARLVGAVYLLGFIGLLVMRQIPGRLIWRCAGLVGLIAVQGAVGWWMVSSGLAGRVEVAPERLMTHLSLALFLMSASIWTGLEALEGEKRGRGAPNGWRWATGILLALVFAQCMLGALVAGNRAGLVYNDWPMMNGHIFPPVEWAKGIGYSFLHDQGLVQFMHRMTAYLLIIFATGFALVVARKANDDNLKTLAAVLATSVWIQAALGVTTLITVVALGFALTHQFVAVCLLVMAVVLAWMMARADRVFR